MKVRLTSAEMAIAAQIGALRQIAAVQAGLADRHGADSANGLTLHAEGAAGELAVAKGLGIYWTPTINTFKSGGDVGPYQVRTRSKADYDLIVRPDDPDSIYILVTGTTPFFSVVGWISKAAAQHEQWWQTYGGRPGAWFVPQADLNELSTLPRPAAELAA